MPPPHTRTCAGLQIWQLYIGSSVVLRSWPALLNSEGWIDVESRDSNLRATRGVCFVGMVSMKGGLWGGMVSM